MVISLISIPSNKIKEFLRLGAVLSFSILYINVVLARKPPHIKFIPGKGLNYISGTNIIIGISKNPGNHKTQIERDNLHMRRS